MTLKRLIYCNLCNRGLNPNESIGLWWNTNNILEERPGLQMEHHVCFPCLGGLLGIAEERGFCKRLESLPQEVVETDDNP